MNKRVIPPSLSPNWPDLIEPGDIVSYRYPVVVPGEGQRPKRRPCLVLDVHDDANGRSVELAYGTSIDGKKQHTHQIRVMKPDSIERAGLDKPTRFVGSQTVTVGTDDPNFVINSHTGAPVIGRLDDELIGRLRTVKQYKAEIAAGLHPDATTPSAKPGFTREVRKSPRRFTLPGAK